MLRDLIYVKTCLNISRLSSINPHNDCHKKNMMLIFIAMNDRAIKFLSKPLKVIPSWMQGAGLGLFLGHVVENNPEFRERLEEIDDKYFLFEATDVDQRFYLYVKDNNIKVKLHHADEPNVIMKGDFSILMGLMMSKVDPDTVFFSRKLEITGDTATALCFKNILDSME